MLAGSAATVAPQLLLVNAKVFTADAAQPAAQAVAVEDGLILAVGSNAQIRSLAGPATRTIDAGGRLLVPGLTEAHVHLAQELPAPPLAMPNLPFPGPTGDQALAAVKTAIDAAQNADGWINAYIGPLVARDPRNWRKALDAVAPTRPVFLRGFWGHTSIVNSEGLRRLGIADDVADPLGGWWGRDEAGRLDSRAYEAAETIGPRIRPATPERLAQAYSEAATRYARWGVTTIHLMNSDKSLDATLAGLALAKTGLKWTVYNWGVWQTPADNIALAWTVIDAAKSRTPDKVRIEGPKWVLDGSPIEQYSRQRDAYVGGAGWRGRSNFTDAQLRQMLQLALDHPTQPALHVVGDAETDRLLKLMTELAPAAMWRAKRVRIEHGDGLRADTLAQAARLGIVVVQNPTHLALPMMPGGLKMLDHPALLASLPAAGIALAFGSDGGRNEHNPFLNLMLAAGYAEPGETLSREAALRAYTAGGAFAERQERRRGRIQPGLAADLALQSQDVLTVPAPQLPATVSLLTLVDGLIVFEDAALAPAK